MNTYDPDRCPAGYEVTKNGRQVVVQCQGSIHHDGAHSFGEDHYTIQWSEQNREETR